MALLEERKFETGEAVLNYAECPDSGPPLVLLHGLTDRWQYFLPIIPALSLRWHLYALDFRGHGGSSRSPPYRYCDHISDTITFLEEVVGEEVVLFGASMGGGVSLMVAGNRPDLVKAIVFGDASINVENVQKVMTDYHSYWAGWKELAAFEGPMEDFVKAVSDMPINVPGQGKITYGEGLDITSIINKANYLRNLDPAVLDDWANGAEDPGAYENVTRGHDQELLRNIDCPVLFLQANTALGGIMPDEEVERALTLVPHAYHVYFEEYGHNLGLYSWNTGPLLQAVNTFLESLR
jgi:pimeloyl-ACP methyl ester carboxylesterase